MGVLSKLKKMLGSFGKGTRTDLNKRFELMGKTGQGSMSRVFKARDMKLGRMVCLKILNKEKTAKFEARFPGLKKPSEGVIGMTLKHQNIVKTFEHGLSWEDEPFLVMELIDGQGLNYLVETRNPSLDGHRIEYLVQIAESLEFIHQQKFLHRDICPRNIMVTKDRVIKIIDFGLAIPYTPEFCRPGNRTGTPDYLAPEVIKRTSTDHRVDLFALGITAYEMITGTLPWEKGDSSQTLLSHMNSAGRDPRDYRKNIDDALAKLLIKSIERDVKARFQTAAEFRDALKMLPKQDY